jgi:hypothetical protein
MAVKTPTKAIAALTTLKALQEDAKRRGLDKMTMEEINAEIVAYRREKRMKRKPHKPHHSTRSSASQKKYSPHITDSSTPSPLWT